MKKFAKRRQLSKSKIILFTFLGFIPFFIIVISFAVYTVSNVKYKKYHQSTEKLCDGWYIEKYLVMDLWLYNTKTSTLYLTDSNGVNKMIGMENSSIKYIFECSEDEIKITTRMYNGLQTSKQEIIYKKDDLKSHRD